LLSNTHLANLDSYTGKTNSFLSSLLSIKETIQNTKENIIDTNFDIADQEIRIMQAEDNLLEAKEELSNYFIRAPFSGMIAEMDIGKGDSVNSSTRIATLITNQKIAEITLNEIDIAKVEIGQKANITFDAIEDLNITGKVVEIDAIGSTMQGVVTYDVKISLDIQDERIKSGMSLSASIITDIKQDTLLVPNSAVKQQGGRFYGEIVSQSGEKLNPATANILGDVISSDLYSQQIEMGLSNETMTEVIDGLKEGDVIVTQTSSSGQSSSNSERFGSGGGGNFMRIMH
ncbi:MAG: efflux RND transporter periplasmic adaptor subunit, partial [Candidatus Hodarchaeales archaeon]